MPINPATQRRLIDKLLDKGYNEATGTVIAAIGKAGNNPALQSRIRDFEREVSRLAADGDFLRYDNPYLQEMIREFRITMERQAELIDAVAPAVQETGIVIAGQVFRETAGQGKSVEELARLGIAFNQPDPVAIREVVQYTESAAWQEMLERYADEGESAAQQIAIRGIVAGQGPETTARELKAAMNGLPTYQANQIMRTLQLTSYRDADVANRVANQSFISYAIRIATLDDRTCVSCIALHGSRLEYNERCDDHQNGRCSTITQITGLPEYQIETGPDWFRKQTKERQETILGGAAFRAYESGLVGLNSFVKSYNDPVFGRMLGAKSLKEMLGTDAKQFYAANIDKDKSPDKTLQGADIYRQALANNKEAVETEAARVLKELNKTGNALKNAKTIGGGSTDAPVEINTAMLEKNSKKQATEAAAWLKSALNGDVYGATAVNARTGAPGRSNYNPNGNSINMSPFSRPDTYVHEIGHALEQANPKLHDLAVSFVQARTEGEKLQSMRDLTGDMGFRSNEMTYADKFISPYIGKLYKNPDGEIFATEVISMGLEMLYNDPLKLATQDPEYYQFMIGVTSGILWKP